ncbi:MAG: hypothetical protein ACJ71Z_07590 [Aeromicrobium sp.]
MLRKTLTFAAAALCVSALSSAAFGADSAWLKASTIGDKKIKESSSLAISSRFAGTAYTANDESSPVVFAIDIASGRTVGKTKLANTKFRDPEALALDGQGTLWLADAGDNKERRRDPALYAFPEQGPANAKVAATRFPIVYSDGLKHNVETLMVNPLNGAKFLVTKSRKAPGTLFALPSTLRPGAPNLATSLPFAAPRNVSDGAISPNGAWAVIRDAKNLYVFNIQTQTLVQTAVAPPVRKGESVAFNPSGSALLVGSEGKKSPLLWVGFDQASGRVATR